MVRDSLGYSHQEIIFIHGDGRGSAKLCLDIHRVDIALLMPGGVPGEKVLRGKVVQED